MTIYFVIFWLIFSAHFQKHIEHIEIEIMNYKVFHFDLIFDLNAESIFFIFFKFIKIEPLIICPIDLLMLSSQSNI